MKGAISRTLLALSLWLPWSAEARAAAPAPSFSVEYEAPAECPPQQDFAGAVASRVPGVELAPAATGAIAFRVILSRSPTNFAGTLWIKLPGAPETRRDVADASCSDAASSLVVMAALVLDGYQRGGGASSGAPPLPTLVATDAAIPAPPPPPPDRTAKVASEPPQPATVTPGLFAMATWESAVAPNAPLGFLGGAVLALRPRGLWAPSLRAGFLYTAWSTVNTAEGSARFRLLSGRILACPLRLGTVLAARACAQLDAGSLQGEGLSASNPQHQAMPWLAAGAAVRAEYTPARVLAIEAGASVQVLARSDQFVFRPDVAVYDVPRVSLGAGVGIVASLP